MIKNHPFQNGNKRIAMTTLFYALYINDLWIKVTNQELYNFAVWIAESPRDCLKCPECIAVCPKDVLSWPDEGALI